jgi:protein SCO1/2
MNPLAAYRPLFLGLGPAASAFARRQWLAASALTLRRSPAVSAAKLRRWLATFIIALIGLGAASGAQAGVIYDVSGHLPDLEFTLSAAGGKTFDSASLKGKTVLLYFGYASCPDICPTTLAQLSEVVRAQGKLADEVRIVFISVDPHRDTPDKLQAYVDAFDKHAIGLTGTESQISDLAHRYRVAYQIEKPAPGSPTDNYDVMHSRGVYIFDKHGHVQLLAADGSSTAALAQKVSALISAN